MKARYTSIFGMLTILLLVASFIVPAKLASPEPLSAATMEWTQVKTPDSGMPPSGVIFSPVITAWESGNPYKIEGGSEIIKLLVGNNGMTMYAIVRSQDPACSLADLKLWKSPFGGTGWIPTAYTALMRDFGGPCYVYDAAIAPDDPNMIIVAVASKFTPWDQEVWISTDGGTWWANTNWAPADGDGDDDPDYISTMDISMDWGSGRYMLVGTRDGTDNDNTDLQTIRVPGFGGWVTQSTGAPFGDIIDANFSPTFIGDNAIVVVTSGSYDGVAADATYLTYTSIDVFANALTWGGIYIPLQRQTGEDELEVDSIINADIELPSDFSGQTPSLRRAYVSTSTLDGDDTGIYRADDTTIYTLMDTSGKDTSQIWSIAYWGTYASGKMLAGNMFGNACTATVPVWYTDSPTVCGDPCWYPCKKCPTGAAGCCEWEWTEFLAETCEFDCEAPDCDAEEAAYEECLAANCVAIQQAKSCTTDGYTYDHLEWDYWDCAPGTYRYGNAYVVWSPTFADQGVAYTVTGSTPWDYFMSPDEVPFPEGYPYEGWPEAILADPVGLDETAMSLTRNNGATWNQISLIDTRISKLTDVVVSPDCTTMYLASTNNNTCEAGNCCDQPANCGGFDSVWRTSMNEAVVAPPLPAAPLGDVWERVLTHVTANDCVKEQSEYAILRLAQDKDDGQVVFWAAGGSNGADMGKWCGTDWLDGTIEFPTGANTNTIEWSPDFGDYWADIRPRVTVQDMAAPTSTTLYVLDAMAVVQKMPYSGTAWSSANATVGLPGPASHTIEAVGDNVLVGMSGPDVAYSSNAGAAFMPVGAGNPAPHSGKSHAIFDTDFATNQTVYAATDPMPNGRVSRNKIASTPWTDMMYTWATAHMSGYFGIVQTNSKNIMKMGTLYAAHAPFNACAETGLIYSGVERTLVPLSGVPKPGVPWSCLDASDNFYQTMNPPVWFTLEPESLKMCGCLTQDTYATLYAIDNDWYGGVNNALMLGGTGIGGVMFNTDRGMLWEYTDCMAKNAPALLMDDAAIIGCDPATGRNQEVNFTWEQLCIATEYQLQIFKDEAKTLAVFDSPCFRPTSVTSPTMVYLSGGEGIGGGFYDDTGFATPSLECGHTYYWRIKVCNEATNDEVDSPWSETRKFTIKAGFRVTTPYYGPQLLSPDNGAGYTCKGPINFSWSSYLDTTTFKFELSENPDMSSPVVSTNVKGTAYAFTQAKCNSLYYWRVMAVEPAPSDWSSTFSFMTQPEPPAPPAPEPEPGTPFWVWVVIAIGAILVIVTLVLIFKTRRV